MKYLNKERLVKEALEEITNNPSDWEDWVRAVIENELKRTTRKQLMSFEGYDRED